MEVHVNTIATFHFDGVICEANRTFVVAENRGRGLRIADGSKHCTLPDTVSGNEIGRALFIFSSRRSDNIKQRADGEYGSIEDSRISGGAEETKPSTTEHALGRDRYEQSDRIRKCMLLAR